MFLFFPLELPQHQGVRYVFQLFLTEGGLSRDPFVPHQAGQGERHCAEQQANGQQGQGRKSAAAVSGAGKDTPDLTGRDRLDAAIQSP